MRQLWPKLGGQLGSLCIALGLIVILLGWNGAAGVDFAQGQIPYLLSGGAFGLGLVVIGAVLIVVQNSRRDRAKLESQLRDLNAAVGRLANAVGSLGGANGRSSAKTGGAPNREVVVAGRTSFHRPTCRLAAGKDLPETTVSLALAEGLTPCRICRPAELVPSGSA
jgi:outer membrane murein-binding lipoprotein Lpp